jgi:hypothetical protein
MTGHERAYSDRVLGLLGANPTFFAIDRVIEALRGSLGATMEAQVIIVDVFSMADHMPGSDAILLGVNLARALKRLPDSSTMLTGWRWNAVPIVLLWRDDALQHFTTFDPTLSGVTACSVIGGWEHIYKVVESQAMSFAERVAQHMTLAGWDLLYHRGRWHRVRLRGGLAASMETALYDARADAYARMSPARQRIYRSVASAPDVIGDDLDAFESMQKDLRLAEIVYQHFFERHAHFLGAARHEMYPHPRFVTDQGRTLFPDIVVSPTPGSLHRDQNIAELKRPRMSLYGRTGESAASRRGRAQTAGYGRWMTDPSHADQRQRMFGISSMQTRLTLIAGLLGSGLLPSVGRDGVRLKPYDQLRDDVEFRHTASLQRIVRRHLAS